MNSSMIALSVAGLAAGGLVIALVALNLLTGTLEFFFGRPTLKFLKSEKGENGFAFSFSFNDSKEPGKFDHVKIRLFNPFGKPEQVEVTRSFEGHKSSFAEDLDFGESFHKILKATNLKKSIIQVELIAKKDGVVHQFDYRGEKFLQKRQEAKLTLKELLGETESESQVAPLGLPEYATHLPKDMTSDTVPGKGAHLKIATNPAFSDLFGQNVPGMGGGKSGAGAGPAQEAQEDFKVAKVWIAEGCIVCDACESIYPEVFDVQADTCVIRPDAGPGSPLLDKGLLIQEAAEACPVEVIKYDKA